MDIDAACIAKSRMNWRMNLTTLQIIKKKSLQKDSADKQV